MDQKTIADDLKSIIESELIDRSETWEVITVGPDKEDWSGTIWMDPKEGLVFDAAPQGADDDAPIYRFRVHIVLEPIKA
jgi:hypothetical protein